MIRNLWAAAFAFVLAAGTVSGQTEALKNAQTGDPQIKSIQALTFGPNGELVIGDGVNGQIVVIDTQDTKPMTWSKLEINDIAGKLAGRIGTTAKSIEIKNLAVNPASKKVYITVRNPGNKKDVLMTVDSQGKIGEFVLDNVRHVRVDLPKGKGPTKLITDVTWAKDRILVTAQANETFASKFLSIKLPLSPKSAGAVFSAETYHVAHRRWETRAPIRVAIPYEENGENYLVGAFTCTPVVKYRIDDMKPTGKIKGQSIIELGSGNRPIDMFVYEKRTEKGKKKYILMNTYRFHHKRRPVGPSPFWTVRIDFDLLAEDEEVNEKALKRVDGKYQPVTDRAVIVESFHGVTHMDKLNNQQAVAIRANKAGQFGLEVLPLP